MKHDLYKDGDKDIPPQILDRNGEVVLALCKVCGQAEGDLEESCNPPTEAWKMYDLARAKMAAELLVERDENKRLRDQLKLEKQEPVAEVVSMYGDPEAFGERRLSMNVDIQTMPYGTKFYAAPQPAVLAAEYTRGRNDGWEAAKLAPHPCPECEKLNANGLVLVTKEDAESYCRILTLLGMEEEGSPIEEVERLLHLREGMVCADCQDTGWLENREEGKYPCTCMTEAEPYQLLEAECEKLKAISVTNILIDVVPGDGSGLEVYAKSVLDVEALLSRLGEKAEDYDWLKPKLEKLKAERDELAARFEKMRATLEAVSMSSLTHQRIRAYIEKALALPDLSTGILNTVRAESLSNAANWFRTMRPFEDGSFDVQPGCHSEIAAVLIDRLAKQAADMEAGK